MSRDSGEWLGNEWRAAVELARLVADPVYYGVGVPHGDGRAVVVLPGLFGGDLYLQPLRRWLGRLGYRPVRSGWALNAGCPERLCRSVADQVSRELGPRLDRMAVIGHSRGGILGWVLAVRLQERVSHLVLLGCPIEVALRAVSESEKTRLVPAPQGLAAANALARRLLDPYCSFPSCGCAFPDDLRHPLSSLTRVTTVRTRDDNIVHPDACVVPAACNVEVGGTHSGLAYNVNTYRHIARALSVDE